MSDEQTPVTNPPDAQPAAQPEGQKQTPTTETQPKPDQLGSQFAALNRKEKALRQQEQQLRAQHEQLQATQKQLLELENLSADEILERIAAKKGATPEDVIKGYIAKKTGAPNDEQALKESKDPAVQALAKKLAEQERANAELKAKLEEKDKSAQDAQRQAAVNAVHTECLQAATEAWTDESNFPDFFDDKQDLAKNVFAFCAQRVTAYEKENGFAPDEADIQALIKKAPELIIAELMRTPRGQRIAALKANGQAKPPLTSAAKPKLSPNVPRVPKDGEEPDEPKGKVRTRFTNDDAVEKLKRQLPDSVTIAGL
jgi:hypothetical protein